MQKKKIAVPTMMDKNGKIKKVYLKPIEVTALSENYPSSTLKAQLEGITDYILRRDNPKSFIKSKYRPTIGDKGEDYYTRNGLKKEVVLNTLGGIDSGMTHYGKKYFYNNFEDAYNQIKNTPNNSIARITSNGTLGRYNISAGEDENGRYISFSDKFDYEIIPGKTINVYDRIYENEFNELYDENSSAINLGDIISKSPVLKKMSEFQTGGQMNNINTFGLPFYGKGGKIHIKKENRGKFTAAAKRAGKSVQTYASQILANKERYSPTLVKRANFARNAAKFKHEAGGIVTPYGQWEYPGEVTIIPSNEITMKGIDYDVLGVSDTGDVKLMTGGNDYKFDGNYVTEYPLKAQQGIHYDFVSKYLPMIQNELSNYSDVNDSIAKNLLYQMAQESKYGTRTPNPTNFWGIKDPGKETYRNFGTLENGLKYWIQQIHDNYPDAWKANDTIEYANGLTTGRNNMRYMSASPDSYMQNMKTLEKQYNLFLQNTSNNITAKDQSGTFINTRDKDNHDISKYGKVIEEENLRDVFGIPVTQYSRFEDGTRMQVIYGNNNVNDTIVGNYITTPKYINKDTLDLKDRFATYDNNGNPIWHKKLEGSFVPIPTVDNKITDYSSAMAKGLFEGNNIADIVGTTLGAASTLAASIGGAVRAKKQENIDTSTTDNSTNSLTENTTTTNTFDPFAKPNIIEQTMRDLTGVDQLKHDFQRNFNFTNRMYGIIGNKLAMPKFMARGGMPSTQAIIEGGEIVDYPDGTQLIDTGEQHEYSGERTYRPNGKIDGDLVEFTGIPMIDLKNNPNLKLLSFGANPWAQGEPFIWPSTVNQKGYVNTMVDNYFPEAHKENKINFVQFGGLMQQPFKKPAKIKRK